MSEEQNNPQSSEAIKAWGEAVVNDLAQRLVTRGYFQKHARVEARWALPGRILIGVAWQADQPNNKVWVIGGEAVPADVVELKVARDAREAARHFSMRWQLNGARLGTAADGDGKAGQIDWKAVEEKLARQAEALHQLAEQDEFWEDIREEPQRGH